MKKLLFILSATILSLTAMAGLNPYAYGLSSSWNAKTQILTVDFKLNDKAKKIEIYAVDPNNKNTKYKIHEISSPGNTLDYSIPIHINGKDKDGTCLPVGKNLTFAVKVDGTAITTPGTPVYTSNRPFSPHGVAVNNYQDSQDFGAVYVTECTNGVSDNATWGWLSDKGKSVLRYNPRLEYDNKFYRKDPNFSDRNTGSKCLEPHRVRVSEDGRVFVTSYNRYDSGNKTIVWELKDGNFVEVIRHNNNGGIRGAYGHRVCGMDVKGVGSSLRILLCFLEESDADGPTDQNTDGWASSFRVYEYDLNNLGSNQNVGVLKFRYRPIGGTNNSNYSGSGYVANCPQAALYLAQYYKWYMYTDGFVNISYAGTDKNNIILSVDYFNGSVYHAQMYCWRNGEPSNIDFNQTQYSSRIQNIMNTKDHYYGGAGLLRYVYNGVEYALSGRAQYGEYNGDGTNSETSGRIQAYKVTGTTISSSPSEYSKSDLKTRKVVNDIAMDCANNVYAVSFTDGANSTGGGSGRLLAYAMPYSGTVTTYCPTSNADDKEYFQLPAVVELNQDLSTKELQQLNENHPYDCGCDIDVNLVRPLQGGMYNTICLPFDLNVNNLATNHPYYNATVLAFNGATISTINNESVLELNFVSTDGVINHSTPYLIRPQSDISSGVRFDNIILQPVYEFPAPKYLVEKNDINYLGVMGKGGFSFDPNEEIVLILVSDNRLAQLSSGGTINGFRGLFYFKKGVIPAGAVVKLTERKDTPTSLIDAQGEVVDVEKFLREGRVYIRMGETLYTIDGVKVE